MMLYGSWEEPTKTYARVMRLWMFMVLRDVINCIRGNDESDYAKIFMEVNKTYKTVQVISPRLHISSSPPCSLRSSSRILLGCRSHPGTSQARTLGGAEALAE